MKSVIFYISILVLLGTCLGIEIPITIRILNAEPEILSIDAPGSVYPGQQFTFTARVRDNNTLNDVVSMFAVPSGNNGTIVSWVEQGWIADVQFLVVVPLDASGNFDFGVVIRDENVTVRKMVSVPVGEAYVVRSITDRLVLEAAPGGSAKSGIVLEVSTSVPITITASVIGDMDVWIGGAHVSNNTPVASVDPSGEVQRVVLPVMIRAPIPMSVQDLNGSIILGVVRADTGGGETLMSILLIPPVESLPLWWWIGISVIIMLCWKFMNRITE